MTFKLRSQVVIYASPVGIPPEPHLVYAREKTLRPGILRTKGYVATDIEARLPRASANVIIRIIDEERLGITWTKDWSSRWPFPQEGFWDPERIIQGEDPLILDDPYHEVWKSTLPEAFTLLDRIRIRILTKSKLGELQGIKEVRRETELRYEPTLPMQSRK